MAHIVKMRSISFLLAGIERWVEHPRLPIILASNRVSGFSVNILLANV
jgi:hypothetical protein